MKFKGALKRPDRLRDVCIALAPVRRECLLKLSPSLIQLVAIPGARGMQVWASLGADEIFENLTLASKDNNEINLEINAEHLLRALRSCVMPNGSSSTENIMLRLSKRDKIPFMILTINRDSGIVGSSRRITQELPVRILNRAACEAIVEPHVAPPHVAICLPDGGGNAGRHQLLRISDRFRQLAPYLLVKANNEGKFILNLVDQGSFNVDTEWVGLTNPQLEDNNNNNSQHMQSLDDQDDSWTRDRLATVRIETRDWSNLLRVLSLRDTNNSAFSSASFASRMASSTAATTTATTIACIRDETALVVYCFLNGVNNEKGGLLTYYLSNEAI